jgi:AAA family ATP:ADP antiporter
LAEEKRLVRLLAAYFFLVMAAAYILLPLKTSSFLKRLDPGYLPLAYLVTAVLMTGVVALNTRFLQAFRGQAYFIGSQLLFIASFLGFRFVLPQGWIGGTIAFWFWTDVFLALSVSQFWILVNDLLSPRRAKRSVGLFVGAGLFGGLAGASFVRLTAHRLGSQGRFIDLFAALLVLAVGVLAALPRRPTGGAEAPGKKAKGVPRVYLDGFRAIRRSRYLIVLSVSLLAAFAVTRIIDFQLIRALNFRFRQDEAAINSFVAGLNLITLVASSVLHLLLSGRILRWFGLGVASVVAPVVLFLGTAVGFAVTGTAWLWWAAAMRAGDKSLSFSLSQSTREILFIPVPQAVKTKAKMTIDLFVNKLGDGVAAGLIFVLFYILKTQDVGLLALLAGLCVVWFLLSRLLVREYVDVVKSHLQLRRPDADALLLEHVDVQATKLVFDTLESRARSSVLYAMNLVDLIEKKKLSPELRAIIAGRSAEIHAGSMDALLGLDGTALLPETEDALDEQALGSQIREIMSLDVYQTLMEKRWAEVSRETGAEAEVSQMEIAKALGLMTPGAPLVRELPRLLRHESSEVAGYALASAGRLRLREFVPSIVAHLGRPATAAAAAEALRAYGDAIAGALVDILLDPDESPAIRLAIPAVLAHSGSPRTTRLLLSALGRGGRDLDGAIVEALSRIRADHPELEFCERTIREHVCRIAGASAETIAALARVRDSHPASGPEPGLALEAALARNVKTIFELLGLLYCREDVLRAYQNFAEGSKRSMDYALDLLEQVLPREVRDTVLPLLEDLPLGGKARRPR